MMAGMSTAMAEARYGGLCNTVKPVTNAQTVRGRPHQKMPMSVHFGSFRELLANISNVAIKFAQVLKRSIEQSMSTNICFL